MPLHDAQSSPLGLGLTIAQWPRDRRIRQLARQRGFTVTGILDVTAAMREAEMIERGQTPEGATVVAWDATPTRAFVDHGGWKAWCPDCIGSAEDLWRDYDLFFCMRCGNASLGGRWRPVIWPGNIAEIEAALEPLPVEMQNWEPWGPVRDPAEVAAEWEAHAAVTKDPDHGLSSNDVGGADDPEVWTPPFVATTNAIIASSDCNAGYRGNLLWIRQFLSANPVGANYWLQSTSADGASWVTRASAVLAAIGYTPLNKAGDTITPGGLSIAGALNIGGATTAGTINAGAISGSSGVFSSTVNIGGTTTAGNINSAAVSGSTGTFSAALSALSAAITNAITAASAAISGLVSAGSLSVSGAAAFSTQPTIGGKLVSRIEEGSYAGDGSAGRSINIGWAPKVVLLSWTNGSSWKGSAVIVSTTAGSTISHGSYNTVISAGVAEAAVLSASGFTVYGSGGFPYEASTNQSGVTYYWKAFG